MRGGHLTEARRHAVKVQDKQESLSRSKAEQEGRNAGTLINDKLEIPTEQLVDISSSISRNQHNIADIKLVLYRLHFFVFFKSINFDHLL